MAKGQSTRNRRLKIKGNPEIMLDLSLSAPDRPPVEFLFADFPEEMLFTELVQLPNKSASAMIEASPTDLSVSFLSKSNSESQILVKMIEDALRNSIEANIRRSLEEFQYVVVVSTDQIKNATNGSLEEAISEILSEFPKFLRDSRDSMTKVIEKESLGLIGSCEMLALVLIPCQSVPEVMEPLKTQELREQYKRVQNQREEIDQLRDQWLGAEAQPLLDELEEYSMQSSLPDSVREEINSLREQLRKDAYGYSKMIDTNDLTEILGIKLTRARELSKEERLGFWLSRIYVYSIEEAQNFAQKERPVGKHRTKS